MEVTPQVQHVGFFAGHASLAGVHKTGTVAATRKRNTTKKRSVTSINTRLSSSLRASHNKQKFWDYALGLEKKKCAPCPPYQDVEYSLQTVTPDPHTTPTYETDTYYHGPIMA